MPRVICDDCPMYIFHPTLGSLCLLEYDVQYDFSTEKHFSDDCRLVKIITKDGEILPEEVEE